ncbi:hypothetical protein D3C73_1254610 [compost metagenome]
MSLPGRGILGRIKTVNEIQLETVKVPIPDSLLIDAGQILPYIRVAGVCNPCTHSIIHIQQLILESFPGLTVLADERNRVPQHEFHSEIMNAANVSLQIWNFIRTHPPVPAIGVTPGLVRGLPTVIHNDRSAAHCCRQATIGFHCFRLQLLVEAVPG